MKTVLSSQQGRIDVVKSIGAEKASVVLATSFLDGINGGLQFLDYFVPENRLQEQNKMNEEINKFLNQVPIEEKERIMSAMRGQK